MIYKLHSRWACRACHDLVYESAQRAHEFDRGILGVLGEALETQRKLIGLQLRLWRCHSGSRNWRRLMARIEKEERKLDVVQQAGRLNFGPLTVAPIA